MTENMTQGSEHMILQRNTMRHDVGNSALALPLPNMTGGEVPVMVNPGIFRGLYQIGISKIVQRKNSMEIEVESGLRAVIPVLHDPHRNIELRVGPDASKIDPFLFKEWLGMSSTIAKAVRSDILFTYRSNVFAFDRVCLIAGRLSAGWPKQSATNAKYINQINAAFHGAEIDGVLCTDSQILCKSGKMQFKVESEEKPMSSQALELLNKMKPHEAEIATELPARSVRQIAEQITLVAQANRRRDGVVVLASSRGNLEVTYQDAVIRSEDIPWNLGKITLEQKAFSVLAHIPNQVERVQLLKPAPGLPHLALRAGAISFILAAKREAE